MKLSLTLKRLVLAMVLGLTAFEIAFASDETKHQGAPAVSDALVIPPGGTAERKGYELFMLNCAHCHGNDARGDEGPDLHGVTRSNARIASLIKNGIKGEMPKFATKLNDMDVEALTTFLRSLKESPNANPTQ
jgi:mono/diheme cytochrome c family protein